MRVRVGDLMVLTHREGRHAALSVHQNPITPSAPRHRGLGSIASLQDTVIVPRPRSRCSRWLNSDGGPSLRLWLFLSCVFPGEGANTGTPPREQSCARLVREERCVYTPPRIHNTLPRRMLSYMFSTFSRGLGIGIG